jgi:hypothetical protein
LRDQPGLYFWHIPKTAGISVWEWLEPHFPADAVFRGHLLPDLLQSAPSEFREKSLFRGHFADAPLQLVSPHLTTITVLREPIARSLSHIAHVERASEHPLHGRVRSYDGDLDRLLSDRVLRRMLQDFQCRYLALHHVPEREPEDAAAWVVAPASPLRAMMAFEMAPLPRRRVLVLRALYRLGRMKHVGVSEHLPRFMRNVAAHQGWAAPAEIPRANTRPPEQTQLLPEHLSVRQRAVLTELTRADRIVYRIASARALTSGSGMPLARRRWRP